MSETAGFKVVDVLKYKGCLEHIPLHLRGMEKQHGLFKCTHLLGEKVIVSFEDKTTFLLTTPTSKHRKGSLEENVLNAIGKETVLSYPRVELERLKVFPSKLVKAKTTPVGVDIKFAHSRLTQQLNITSKYDHSEEWIYLFHRLWF